MNIRGFLRLIRKYRDGVLPPGKREIMDRWYDAIGEEPGDIGDKSQLKERIWKGIVSESDRNEPEQEEIFRENKWRRLPDYLVSGMIVLLLVAGSIYYLRLEEDSGSQVFDQKQVIEWVREENDSGEKKEILLADGSRIVLEPGSVLRYPPRFAPENRSVEMEGNVFFEITGDPDRPFFVRAGDILVRVLGTSFTITETDASHATEVAVITGKVVVEKRQSRTEKDAKKQGDNRIVLTPNKKVTFFRDSDHYITGLVDNPVLVETSEEYLSPEAFDFDDMPLLRILEKLEKAYGVSFAVSNESLLDCRITADLSSDNLYGKVEVIGAILGAGYEIKESTILLSGGTCKILEK